MYYSVVTHCSQTLRQLETWLDKAEQYAAAKKFDVEVLMNAAGSHAAQFAIDKREIGKNRQTECQDQNAADVGPKQHQASPNRPRSMASTRSISPRSVS